MIKEYRFKFDELTIEYSEVKSILGYRDEKLPEPFCSYLDMAYQLADTLDDIAAVIKVVDTVEFMGDKDRVIVGGSEFYPGKRICAELRNSTQAAFFICTAGEKISDLSHELMHGSDPLLGFIYDTMGSFIAEAVGDKMHELLQVQLKSKNLKTTNRYSPGYCNWPVNDQHKLFTFFEGVTAGVSLTDSALMKPVKSISGIIGIGENVRFRNYQCEMCNSKSCIYRNLKSKLG